MDRREARTALRLADEWHKQRLLPSASLETLRARYSAAAAGTGESFGTGVLYGLGGVLLGAAAFALLFLLEENGIISDSERVAPWLFLAWGLFWAAAAFSTDLGLRKLELGDAFHVAALVAITASGIPRADELWLWAFAMAYALAVVAYRRERWMLPVLALIAFNVAVVSFVWGRLERTSDELAMAAWFALAAAQLATLVLQGRIARRPWSATAIGLATLLLAGTFLGFYFETADDSLPQFAGDAEVYVAVLMAALMAVGLWLKEKGMVLACALVVAIDAIVFAFDVGELIGGLIAILAVAGLLIWQAGSLRRYLRED
jgi:hypothetical protein